MAHCFIRLGIRSDINNKLFFLLLLLLHFNFNQFESQITGSVVKFV